MSKRDKPKLEELIAKLKMIKARDIMTKDVVTIKEDATLAEAAGIMVKKRISGMPVIGRRGNVTGVITETDLFIVMDMIESGDVLEDNRRGGFNPIVKFAMSTDTIKIKANASLDTIVSIVKYHNIHTLPVFDGGKMVGVIGRHDIFHNFYNVIQDIQ